MTWTRPDWTKPEEYPDQASTSNRQWAWEFLRRNSQYEAIYAQLVEDLLPRLHAGDPDAAIDYSCYSSSWGISELVDPATAYENLPIAFEFTDYSKPEVITYDALALGMQLGVHHPGQVWVRFDLQSPVSIRQQSNLAQEQLKVLQANLPQPVEQRKRDFLLYLRVLDAALVGKITEQATVGVLLQNDPKAYYGNDRRAVEDALLWAQHFTMYSYRRLGMLQQVD